MKGDKLTNFVIFISKINFEMIETNISFSKKLAALFLKNLFIASTGGCLLLRKKAAADEWNLGFNETIIIKFKKM